MSTVLLWENLMLIKQIYILINQTAIKMICYRITTVSRVIQLNTTPIQVTVIHTLSIQHILTNLIRYKFRNTWISEKILSIHCLLLAMEDQKLKIHMQLLIQKFKEISNSNLLLALIMMLVICNQILIKRSRSSLNLLSLFVQGRQNNYLI